MIQMWRDLQWFEIGCLILYFSLIYLQSTYAHLSAEPIALALEHCHRLLHTPVIARQIFIHRLTMGATVSQWTIAHRQMVVVLTHVYMMAQVSRTVVALLAILYRMVSALLSTTVLQQMGVVLITVSMTHLGHPIVLVITATSSI